MSANKDEELRNLLAELPGLVSLLQMLVRDRKISGSLYTSQINQFIEAYQTYIARNE